MKYSPAITLKIFAKGFDWVVLMIMVLFVILKKPLLSLPFYWDEAWVYAPAVKKMAENGPSLLPDAIPVSLSRGHPLLFHYLGGLWSSVFGTSHAALHAYGLAISLVTFGAIYQIGSWLVNKQVGLLAMVLSMTQATFFVQSTFVLPEMMVTLWVLVSLFAFITDRKWLYLFSGSALLLTKESGMVALLSVIGFFILEHFFYTRSIRLHKSQLSQLSWLGAPVVVFGTFLLIQKISLGWFFYPEHTGMVTFQPGMVLGKIKGIAYFLFSRNARWLFWISMLLSIWILVQNRTIYDKRLLPLIRFTLLGFLFMGLYSLFTSVNFYSTRYLLCVLPFLIIPTAGFCWYSLKNRPALWIGFFLITALSGVPSLLDTSRNGDTDPGFSEAVRGFQEVIHYCEQQKWHQEHIATDFLMKNALTEPSSGYLSQNAPFSNISWSINENTSLVILGNIEGGAARLEQTKKKYLLTPVKRFETKNTWFEIFRVNKAE